MRTKRYGYFMVKETYVTIAASVGVVVWPNHSQEAQRTTNGRKERKLYMYALL